jgi:restriction system protein
MTVPHLQPFELLALLALFSTVAALWGYARRRLRRRSLWARQRDLATLKAMTWQEFELLVGETFRRLGYRVAETGGGGADGGADLVVTKGGRRFVIQCKHYRTGRVGAPVVREIVGVAVHEKAQGAFVVTVGSFTKAAQAFAQGKPLHLIDGQRLLRMIEKGRVSRS